MNHIFISHAGPDSTVAQNLADDLKDAGHDVVIDLYDLSLGDNLISFMNEGISQAHTIIIIYSKHTDDARWQTAEVDATTWYGTIHQGVTIIVLNLDDTELPPL